MLTGWVRVVNYNSLYWSVMVRPRKQNPQEVPRPADAAEGIDVNAIVSYNLRWIRERHGFTQQQVANKLAALTGHLLPQASISAMERGFDGERRRRFDAHELYLLSLVFEVPIVYFFLPPPDTTDEQIIDSRLPVSTLVSQMLGRDDELKLIDERLEAIGIKDPADADPTLAATLGGPDKAVGNWYPHFRTWRKQRLFQLEKQYGDRLEEVAVFLKQFSDELLALGPRGYLQSRAYMPDEEIPEPDPNFES